MSFMVCLLTKSLLRIPLTEPSNLMVMFPFIVISEMLGFTLAIVESSLKTLHLLIPRLDIPADMLVSV